MTDTFFLQNNWDGKYYNCLARTRKDKTKKGKLFVNSGRVLGKILREAATRAGATIEGSIYKNFKPKGASAIVLIGESHLAIHTYPERGVVIFSFDTCGPEMDGKQVIKYVGEQLQAKRCSYRKIGVNIDKDSVGEEQEIIFR